MNTCEYFGCDEPIECILDDHAGDRLAALCQRHKAALTGSSVDRIPELSSFLKGGALNGVSALLEYAECKGVDDEYFLRGKIRDLIDERCPTSWMKARIADAVNGAGLKNQVAVLLTNLGPRGAKVAIDDVAVLVARGELSWLVQESGSNLT